MVNTSDTFSGRVFSASATGSPVGTGTPVGTGVSPPLQVYTRRDQMPVDFRAVFDDAELAFMAQGIENAIIRSGLTDNDAITKLGLEVGPAEQKIFEGLYFPGHIGKPFPVKEPVQQQPIGVQQQPIGVQQQPISVQQQPISVQQQPIGVQQQPIVVQQQPIVVQQQPIDVQQQPIDVQQQPIVVQQQPIVVQQQPIGVQQQPIDVQQQPIGVQQPVVQPQGGPELIMKPLGMGDFQVCDNKSDYGFNLLGCIVFMARFPETPEGKSPVFNAFGDRPEIVSQISNYIKNPNNLVVHDPVNRRVHIRRSRIYALVKGETIPDQDNRIIRHFGNSGDTTKISDPSIRNYFSTLMTAWRKNKAEGNTGTYLNTYDYVTISKKECDFVFMY